MSLQHKRASVESTHFKAVRARNRIGSLPEPDLLSRSDLNSARKPEYIAGIALTSLGDSVNYPVTQTGTYGSIRTHLRLWPHVDGHSVV